MSASRNHGAGVFWLLAAAVLAMAATWMSLSTRRPGNGAPLQEALRAIARPVAVPLAWSTLENARRAGHVHEAAGKARNLLALMPCWADGHLLYAMELALAPSARVVAGEQDNNRTSEQGQTATTNQQRDRDLAQNDARVRLFAAVAWLQDAALDCPDHEGELLSGAAFLLEQTEERDPELAARLRDEGRNPLVWADELHARVAAAGDSFGADRAAAVRVALTPALMADRLRSGDVPGARRLAQRGLDFVPRMTADGQRGWGRALTAARDALALASTTKKPPQPDPEPGSLQSSKPESRRPKERDAAVGPTGWTDVDRADPRLEPLWPWMNR